MSEKNISEEQKGNYYIIADHLRTVIFALADGAIFEPKGRGYILKKLIKRVVLTSYLLNIDKDNLQAISEKLIETNSSFYPYLTEKKNLIINEIGKEINKSFKSIENSLHKLENYYSSSITANDIFFWYDTLGIPYELIDNYLVKKNHPFPQKEFNELLTRQKERSLTERKKKNISIF